MVVFRKKSYKRSIAYKGGEKINQFYIMLPKTCR